MVSRRPRAGGACSPIAHEQLFQQRLSHESPVLDLQDAAKSRRFAVAISQPASLDARTASTLRAYGMPHIMEYSVVELLPMTADFR